MKPMRFKAGDDVAVYACGILVDVRTIVAAKGRRVTDSAGGSWGQGGERWGFRDRAVDGDYIRPAEEGDGEAIASPAGKSQRAIAAMRSALRRFPWAAPSRGPDRQPSGATVIRAYQLMQTDDAFRDFLTRNA